MTLMSQKCHIRHVLLSSGWKSIFNPSFNIFYAEFWYHLSRELRMGKLKLICLMWCVVRIRFCSLRNTTPDSLKLIGASRLGKINNFTLQLLWLMISETAWTWKRRTKQDWAKHYKIHHSGTGNFQKQGVSWTAVFQALMTKTVNDTMQKMRRDLWRLKTEESNQKYHLSSKW